MRRFLGGILLVACAVVSLVQTAPAGAAPAQATATCFPGSNPSYPPTGGAVRIESSLRLVSGQFNVGASGTIVITGAGAGARYCGTTFSTPISLPATVADATGALRWTIPVPNSFELNAPHHIDVFREQVQVGSFDFCVNKTGAIAPLGTCGTVDRTSKVLATSGGLPKTGTNVMDLVRIALMVLAVGAGALYLRRRGLHRAA